MERWVPHEDWGREAGGGGGNFCIVWTRMRGFRTDFGVKDEKS